MQKQFFSPKRELTPIQGAHGFWTRTNIRKVEGGAFSGKIWKTVSPPFHEGTAGKLVNAVNEYQQELKKAGVAVEEAKVITTGNGHRTIHFVQTELPAQQLAHTIVRNADVEQVRMLFRHFLELDRRIRMHNDTASPRLDLDFKPSNYAITADGPVMFDFFPPNINRMRIPLPLSAIHIKMRLFIKNNVRTRLFSSKAKGLVEITGHFAVRRPSLIPLFFEEARSYSDREGIMTALDERLFKIMQSVFSLLFRNNRLMNGQFASSFLKN
ncbi:MAG: DUF6206 family protein [Candidatus Micrarchaeota archaeon]